MQENQTPLLDIWDSVAHPEDIPDNSSPLRPESSLSHQQVPSHFQHEFNDADEDTLFSPQPRQRWDNSDGYMSSETEDDSSYLPAYLNWFEASNSYISNFDDELNTGDKHNGEMDSDVDDCFKDLEDLNNSTPNVVENEIGHLPQTPPSFCFSPTDYEPSYREGQIHDPQRLRSSQSFVSGQNNFIDNFDASRTYINHIPFYVHGGVADFTSRGTSDIRDSPINPATSPFALPAPHTTNNAKSNKNDNNRPSTTKAHLAERKATIGTECLDNLHAIPQDCVRFSSHHCPEKKFTSTTTSTAAFNNRKRHPSLNDLYPHDVRAKPQTQMMSVTFDTLGFEENINWRQTCPEVPKPVTSDTGFIPMFTSSLTPITTEAAFHHGHPGPSTAGCPSATATTGMNFTNLEHSITSLPQRFVCIYQDNCSDFATSSNIDNYSESLYPGRSQLTSTAGHFTLSGPDENGNFSSGHSKSNDAHSQTGTTTYLATASSAEYKDIDHDISTTGKVNNGANVYSRNKTSIEDQIENDDIDDGVKKENTGDGARHPCRGTGVSAAGSGGRSHGDADAAAVGDACRNDPDLDKALKEFCRTGKQTALIKEELKRKILYQRSLMGKDNMPADQAPAPSCSYSLTVEEQRKQKRKRELNRQAAKRMRARIKNETNKNYKTLQQEQDRNTTLKAKVQKLQDDIEWFSVMLGVTKTPREPA